MPIIRFESVSKEFSPESYALKEVSFVVDPGELVFITGPSGSGKTTLMRLLTKEYTPTDGEIFFHDQPLSDIKMGKVHHHRRKIGVVFQDYRLVPEMNVWENIALPLYVSGKKQREIEQRVTDLLNLIKLPEKANQFPSQLSGGEAQRVSIARALSVGPEIIFADEPTGNLDPDTSRSIARLLRKINELGTTILVATHDVEVIGDHKDLRQLRLENGRVVEDQPHTKTHSEKAKKHERTASTSLDTDSVTDEAFEQEDQPSAASINKNKHTVSLFDKLFGKKKTAAKSEEVTTNTVPTESSDQAEDSTNSQPSAQTPNKKTVKTTTHSK